MPQSTEQKTNEQKPKPAVDRRNCHVQCIHQRGSVTSYTKIQYRWPTEGLLHSAHHVIAALQALRDEVNNTPLIGLIHKGPHRVVPSKKSGILVSDASAHLVVLCQPATFVLCGLTSGGSSVQSIRIHGSGID